MDAKTSSETLRKRNGSFPSVKSDSPTSPGSPREAQPPISGISNRHLQGLPGAFWTPKRPPKRCENATVRSQVSNLIPPPPREAPGRLNPPFRESQTGIFKASRGLFDAKTSSETLRKRNGSFPSVKSDSPTSPGSPREAQPPISGISNRHLQGLPGAFLTPKRPPKRCENATVRSQVSNLIPPPPREAPGRLNPPFRESQTGIFKASRGLFDAKTSSETLRKRNGSFPSVKSDSPTSPGSPREAQPPISGISNRHLQGLPGAFWTPKRPPKRCENATVRSQVSNLIPPPPREAPGRLNPPFRESQTGIFKASRGLFGRQNVLRNVRGAFFGEALSSETAPLVRPPNHRHVFRQRGQRKESCRCRCLRTYRHSKNIPGHRTLAGLHLLPHGLRRSSEKRAPRASAYHDAFFFFSFFFVFSRIILRSLFLPGDTQCPPITSRCVCNKHYHVSFWGSCSRLCL